MSDWNYTREEPKFEVKTGIQRCVIVDVEETTSSKGNPMIVVTVQPSGSKARVKNFIVKNDYFNRNMTDLYNSFTSIPEGNFDFISWIGAEGAALFAPDDRDPKYLKVKYFVSPEKAKDLPPYSGERPTQQTVTNIETFTPVDDSGLPF